LDLFDKLVTPILNYCSEVCGFTNNVAIERIHLQFCKRILAVKKTTQNDFVYGELGRTSLKCTHFLNIIKFWIKIIHSHENKYVHRVYHMLKNDYENFPNRLNWCSSLKELLCTLGFFDAWLQQSVGNIDLFLYFVKQRINDQFIQNWYSRINESSRALFYRNIACFQFQPYLEFFNVNKFCQSMTRLRVSSHRLNIEAGRWTRPIRTPVNERKCSVCNSLEDEYHFIMECPLFINLRKQYINKKFWKRPNMIKFIELLKSEDKKVVQKLGLFIHKAFILRNEYFFSN
jgi:hypothetical protein